MATFCVKFERVALARDRERAEKSVFVLAVLPS